MSVSKSLTYNFTAKRERKEKGKQYFNTFFDNSNSFSPHSSKDASIFRLLYHERGWERREHQEAKDSRNHRTFTLDETREATPRVYFPTPSNPQQLTFLWTLPVTGAVSYAVGAQELPACLQ